MESLDALDAAGVDTLLLKGGALARMLYGPDEQRGYFDVDLLVAPGDLAAARRVLADLGYGCLADLRGIDDVAGVLHAETWSRRVPDLAAVMIDLHWRIDGCRAPAQTAWNVLSAHRAWVALGERRVATLDRSGLALHLGLHAAQHGTDDLKALGDLNRGLQRWPREVWRQAAQLARDLQAVEAFAAGLQLMPAGAALSEELGLPAANAVLWELEHRAERPRGTFHLQAYREAPNLRGRARVLRRSLLPRREWITWEHPWAARSGPRLAAAYGVHMLHAPLWAVRAWRFRRRARRAAG